MTDANRLRRPDLQRALRGLQPPAVRSYSLALLRTSRCPSLRCSRPDLRPEFEPAVDADPATISVICGVDFFGPLKKIQKPGGQIDDASRKAIPRRHRT